MNRRCLGQGPHDRRSKSQPGYVPAGAQEFAAIAGLKVEHEYSLTMLPFTDWHMLRPSGLLEILESILSRIGLFAPLAQNLIYVCRHAESEP